MSFIKNLENFEKSLTNFRIDNIEISGLFADRFIYLLNHNKKLEISKFKSIKTFLINFIKVGTFFFGSKQKTTANKKILFHRISNRENLKNLMDPLISKLSNNSFVITHDCEVVFKEGVFLNKLYLKPIYFVKLLVDLFRFSFFLLKSKNLDGLRLFLFAFSPIQFARFYFFREFLSKKKPAIIVVEFDRHYLASPLVLASRFHKIPSITMVHGFIGDYGYTPIISDYIFCHSNLQKRLLINQGVDESKVQIVGSTLLKKINNSSRKFDINKVNIAFVINPSDSKFVENYYSMVSKFFKLSNIKFYLKLHPSQTNKYKNNFKHFHIFEGSNEDFIKEIDLVFFNSSSFGIECAFNGIPVVMINNHDFNSVFLTISQNMDFHIINESHELFVFLKNYLYDENFRESIILNNDITIKNTFPITGLDSVKISCDLISCYAKL